MLERLSQRVKVYNSIENGLMLTCLKSSGLKSSGLKSSGLKSSGLKPRGLKSSSLKSTCLELEATRLKAIFQPELVFSQARHQWTSRAGFP